MGFVTNCVRCGASHDPERSPCPVRAVYAERSPSEVLQCEADRAEAEAAARLDLAAIRRQQAERRLNSALAALARQDSWRRGLPNPTDHHGGVDTP